MFYKDFKFIIYITILLAHNYIVAQSNSQWFSVSNTSVIYPSYKAFDSNIDNTIDNQFFIIDTFIQNPHITYLPIDIKIFRYLLYRENKIDSVKFFANRYKQIDYNNDFHQWRLFGLRGKLNGREVLIIDSNHNKNFLDDELIILDTLLIQFPQDQLNTKNIYPIQNYITLPISFQYILNGQIYNLKNKLGFGVRSKYDTLQKKMYYLDDFSVGFSEKLHFDCQIDNEYFNLAFERQFPWQGKHVDITFNYNNIKQSLKLKNSFKLKDDKISFIIDSIDFLNNRVLITKLLSSPKQLDLSSFNKISSNQKMKYSQYKVLHFWGSWCAGCIKNFPNLRNLSIDFSDINFIGVAVDNNIDLVERLINKSELNWEMYQIGFTDFRKVNENNLNIQSYPTYLVLNDKNDIFARFSSIHDLSAFLKTLKQ